MRCIGRFIGRLTKVREALLTTQLPIVSSMFGCSSSIVFVRDDAGGPRTHEWSGVLSLHWSILGRVIDYAALQSTQVVSLPTRAASRANRTCARACISRGTT